MTNNYLSRGEAPIAAATWDKLDQIIIEAAKSVLSGRRILNIDGPYGLGLKAVPMNDPEMGENPVTGTVLPLALISKSFTMAKRDIAAHESNGVMLNTSAAAAAAIACAKQEEELIYNGLKDTPGLMNAKGSHQLKLGSWSEVGTAADDIIKAVTALDTAGFHGPYTLALAPERYNLLLRRYPTGSFSELEHVKTIAAEGVVKAPVLEGGGLLLAAGRQYATLVLGQDLAAGYNGPAAERLEFYVSESLIPYIRQPKAICVLKES